MEDLEKDNKITKILEKLKKNLESQKVINEKITKILEKFKKNLESQKVKDLEYQKERFDKMKPFKSIDDIPDLPIIKDPEKYREIVVSNLIRCGAIPKDSLVIGAEYEGACRNASTAVWNGKEFEYKRLKWGMWQNDTINHFEDDDGYDLFVPLKKLNK